MQLSSILKKNLYAATFSSESEIHLLPPCFKLECSMSINATCRSPRVVIREKDSRIILLYKQYKATVNLPYITFQYLLF